MKQKEGNAALDPKDIVFECPNCTKSLVIDARAAGLMATCPDCGHEVQIPGCTTPNVSAAEAVGSALADAAPVYAPADASDEADLFLNTKAQDADDLENGELPEVSKVLADAHEQINTLQNELDELRLRRKFLERRHAVATRSIQALKNQVQAMRVILDQMDEQLRKLTAPHAGDTQPMPEATQNSPELP